MRRTFFQQYTLLFMLVLLAGSCKKDKLQHNIEQPDVLNASPSGIRFFNYYGNADVTINNTPLTAYPASNSQSGGTTIGLAIFPTGVWASGDNASPFSVPNSLLDKDGNIRLKISPRGGGALPGEVVDTLIANNVVHPLDYYLMPNGKLKVLARDNMPSPAPQNFKVRIINLASEDDQLNLGLKGPVSLTYADGSVVDQQLNNVAAGAASPYIELPYGAYQFKLFVAGGGTIDISKQLAEFPVPPYYDPCNPAVHPQEGLTSRLRTFKPGGVYSLVVTLNRQDLFLDCNHFNLGAYVNSYRVVTELDPGVNYTFARMQAVNALPGKQITINVDGQPLGGQLTYAGLSEANIALTPEYKIFVQGSHRVEAKDVDGKVLATADIRLYPYDNYTIWAYHTPEGKPAILFESNDMTGSMYASSYHPDGAAGGTVPDDGTNGVARRAQYNYALQMRFLNLAPDLPYATFTNDHRLFLPATGTVSYLDTVRHSGSYVNMAPGVMPARNPAILYSLPSISPGQGNLSTTGATERQYMPSLIRVFQSVPGNLPQVPGTLLENVAPVDMVKSFVANADLYSSSAKRLPETGVYTVALVGNVSNTAPAGEKARLIVIKHNK